MLTQKLRIVCKIPYIFMLLLSDTFFALFHQCGSVLHQIFQNSLLTLNSVTSPNQTCPFFQIVSFCLSLTNHTCSLFMFLGSTETLSSEAFPSNRYVNFTHKPRTLSKWTLIQGEINVDTEGEYELSVLIDVSRCPIKN